MARAKPRTTKAAKDTAPSALRLQLPSEALAALLRERSRLLKAIAKKQVELESERERTRDISQALFDRMQPLMREREGLLEEIHQLFEGLLVEGRLSRSARKKIEQVYCWLNDSGELEPIGGEPKDTSSGGSTWDFDPDDEWSPASAGNPEAEVASAKQAGGQPGSETLRGLFRRLIVALHPDLVQQEAEQKRRTDVMKEVTRAYEEGNLARLIELEQLWLSGSEVRGRESDDTAKCVELERIVRELQTQQKALATEMKELRRSSPLSEIFGARRVAPAKQREQLEEILAAASEELEPLRQIRNLARSFSERKISLADFLRGPAPQQPEVFDITDEILMSVLHDLDMNFGEQPATKPRGSRPRKTSKRGNAGVDGCPF